jgi:RimJ/RimL family protein N-acetyltransferase
MLLKIRMPAADASLPIAPAPTPIAAVPAGDDVLPTIPAARLRLRRLGEGDVAALFEVFSHPQVMRYWSRPPYESEDDARILLESIERGARDGTLLQWGIARASDDRVIGTCTLAGICHENGRAEVGFALGRPHWGQRYANEALVALLDHAFGALRLHRIEADVDPRNTPSLRTLERLGFVREGYLRQRWAVGGERQDSVLLGLLASDWSALRASA